MNSTFYSNYAHSKKLLTNQIKIKLDMREGTICVFVRLEIANNLFKLVDYFRGLAFEEKWSRKVGLRMIKEVNTSMTNLLVVF